MARFTTTPRTFGVHSFCCSTATSSPVIITTGTPYQCAIRVLSPPSPADRPLTWTSFDDAGTGVGEQSARRVGLGVIADKDDGIERLVESFDHAVTLEAVADQPRARIEIFRQQVALAAV